jgi:hypothetical protein
MDPVFPFSHQIQMALSDQIFQSFIDATAGNLVNLTQIVQELTGNTLQSHYFCWLPSLCDVYPKNNPVDLGFALSFDSDTSIHFLDGNQWTFNTKAVRIVANKGDAILHDFTMNEISAAMKLFVNEDGSLDGSVQNLHFTGGEIVTPGEMLVDEKQIGWIAGPFQYLQAVANGNPGLSCDHLRLNELLFGVYAKTLDLQFRDGFLFFGFDIDPIYIGMP